MFLLYAREKVDIINTNTHTYIDIAPTFSYTRLGRYLAYQYFLLDSTSVVSFKETVSTNYWKFIKFVLPHSRISQFWVKGVYIWDRIFRIEECRKRVHLSKSQHRYLSRSQMDLISQVKNLRK
jgi:hypothetical protein